MVLFKYSVAESTEAEARLILTLMMRTVSNEMTVPPKTRKTVMDYTIQGGGEEC